MLHLLQVLSKVTQTASTVKASYCLYFWMMGVWDLARFVLTGHLVVNEQFTNKFVIFPVWRVIDWKWKMENKKFDWACLFAW